jgi:soluble lytic murein transglycosylase-like protein
MSLGALHQNDIDTALSAMAARPPEPAQRDERTAWSAPWRATKAATAEVLASTADVLKGFGAASAMTMEADPLARAAVGEQRARQGAAEGREQIAAGTAMQSGVGESFRNVAKDLAPDPATAGMAEQLVFGVVRPVTKLVAGAVIGGPIGMAAAAAEEGFTQSEELRTQGVDVGTRTAVGALTAAATAAGAFLPIAGQTLKGTAALYALGGPGAFMAQQQATRSILENADYADLAKKYDPLDPVGLAVSALVPLPFAAAGAVRNARTARAAAAGDLNAMTLDQRRALRYNAPALDAHAEQMANKYGVPPEILLAVKNAGEKSGPTATSPKGARGVMQFMPATWKEMGGGDITDPVVAIERGAQYLAKLHNAYGDWRAAVAHYNGGGSQAALVRSGGAPSFKETNAYLQRVDAYVAEMRKTTGTAPPPAPATAQRDVDAAMVHNLTLRQDIHDAGMPKADTMGVPRADALSPIDRAIENRLAETMARDFDGAAAAYAAMPDSMGGRVLSDDMARRLSPEAAIDPARGAAAQAPADWFVGQMYARRVAELQPGAQVLMTTGGAPGRADVVRTVPALRDAADQAALVLDANLGTADAAAARIDAALDAGATVRMVHVKQGRDPVVDQVAKRYKDDPRVTVSTVEDTRPRPPREDGAPLAPPRPAETDGPDPVLSTARAAGDAAPAPAAAAADGQASPDLQKALQDATARPADATAQPAGTGGLVSMVGDRVAAIEQQTPDLVVGKDEGGKPVTAAEVLQAARREAAEGTDVELGTLDADLVRVAAECALATGTA